MLNTNLSKKVKDAELAHNDSLQNQEKDTKPPKVIDIKKGQSLNDVVIKNNEDEEKYTVIHLTEDYLSKNYLFR